MLSDISAENFELAPGSFHTGSEGVAKSGCRQLGNAVGLVNQPWSLDILEDQTCAKGLWFYQAAAAPTMVW